MRDYIEKYTKGEFTAYVGFDNEVGFSPREWSNLGTIYSNHRNYSPDNHSFRELMEEDGSINFKKLEKDNILLTIRGYEHSGLTIAVGDRANDYPFHDRWDSGLFGIIMASKKDVCKAFKSKIVTKAVREKALNCLEGEIKTLDQYINGEVYCYTVEDKYGDIVDSVCDYYDFEQCKSEAQDSLEWEYEKKEDNDIEEKLSYIAAAV